MKQRDLDKHRASSLAFEMQLVRQRAAKERDALRRGQREAISYAMELEEQQKFLHAIKHADINRMAIEPSVRSGQGEGTAIIGLSDVHPFKIIRPATVHGRNKYNPTICRESVAATFRGGLKWTQIHRAGTTIKTLILWLGGGKFPAGRRPYDVEMSWAGMDWHIEFKLSKLKRVTTDPVVLMSPHQREALHLRAVAGNRQSLVAVYYEALRVLHIMTLPPTGIPVSCVIRREGPGFKHGDLGVFKGLRPTEQGEVKP